MARQHCKLCTWVCACLCCNQPGHHDEILQDSRRVSFAERECADSADKHQKVFLPEWNETPPRFYNQIRTGDMQLHCLFLYEKVRMKRASVSALVLVLRCKSQHYSSGISFVWGAGCSRKMASHWAGKTCCPLFSALPVCLQSLFNITGIFHPGEQRVTLKTINTTSTSSVCFISIQTASSLFVFLSSSRSVIHHQMALCQSVMHISLLLLIMKFNPFSLFPQAPIFNSPFYHSQHSSILCLWILSGIIYSSRLCSALWEFVGTYLTYN